MKQQQENKTSTPFKSNRTVELLSLLATTALLSTRNFIGLKTLSIGRLALLLSIFAPLTFATTAPALFVITIQTLALGISHLLQNNKKLLKGKIVDPFSLGVSRYTKFFPKSVSANTAQRWFDPAICCLMGIIVGWIVSWGVGGWMMFSGLSLCLFEGAVQNARASQISHTRHTTRKQFTY
ncbi:MAG: hypothetical protein JWM68_2080 [Verrucomicrobiales bacterium]|nr:hypothetical protein [Verrucomicrobiales bacterium]